MLIAVPLTACGEGGGEGLLPTPTRSITLPTPTRSITASPTRSPAPSETPTEEPTEEPQPSESEAPSESPTRTAEPTPTETVTETETATETATPTEEPTPTETVTETATPSETPTPTETATPSESPSPTETTEPEETSADDDADAAPAWVWWLLALLLLAAAIGTPLHLWAKRRRDWRADLAAAEADLAWLARTLLPDLRQNAESSDRVSGGWDVGGAGRATATEDRLTALEASAPDASAGDRARALRDAVRTARGRLDALESAATPESVRSTLDSAVADLESALGTPHAE